MSSWLLGLCVVHTGIYRNFVLFTTSKCNKQDTCANGPTAMGSFKISIVEMEVCKLFVIFQKKLNRNCTLIHLQYHHMGLLITMSRFLVCMRTTGQYSV